MHYKALEPRGTKPKNNIHVRLTDSELEILENMINANAETSLGKPTKAGTLISCLHFKHMIETSGKFTILRTDTYKKLLSDSEKAKKDKKTDKTPKRGREPFALIAK